MLSSRVVCNLLCQCLIWISMLLSACHTDPNLQYSTKKPLPIEIIEQLQSLGLETDHKGKATCIVSPRAVTSSRQSIHSGFYREIHTSVSVHLDPMHRCSTCDLLLIETLPEGLYVDVYQMAGAVKFGGPKVVAFEEIDLEKPAYLSDPHTILVYPSSQSTIMHNDQDVVNFTAEMPVHLRYHRPSASPEYQSARVTLPVPYLLIKCKGETVEESTEGQTGDWSVYQAPCDGTSKALCSWQLLPQSKGSEELYFDVPVGQQSHMVLVTSVTILATIIGTVVLLLAMTWNLTKYKPC